MTSSTNEYEILASSTVDILPREEFIRKLEKSRSTGKPLRIKYGADPSAPDIHIGHSVPIRKLKQFQDLGHQVVFIIGDYTARIGDPSGKNAARPRLTKAEVDVNARTYLEQIFKILDRDKTEVVYNSQWLENMDVTKIIEFMGRYTVSQMLEREDFHKRFESETPIFMHEFIYPLLVGYDSLVVRADVELGGTDQKFNLLVGREFQRAEGMEQQCIMTMPLLQGLDGVNKMSKSLGNYIGVSEPPQSMFGKAMSIPDALMWDYFELATGASSPDVAALKQAFDSGLRHPRDIKEELARRLVSLYHGADAANKEAGDFRGRFTLREFPDATAERIELTVPEAPNLQQLLLNIGAAKSSRELQRLAEQGAIKVIEEPVSQPIGSSEGKNKAAILKAALVPGSYKMKIGKTRFVVVMLR